MSCYLCVRSAVDRAFPVWGPYASTDYKHSRTSLWVTMGLLSLGSKPSGEMRERRGICMSHFIETSSGVGVPFALLPEQIRVLIAAHPRQHLVLFCFHFSHDWGVKQHHTEVPAFPALMANEVKHLFIGHFFVLYSSLMPTSLYWVVFLLIISSYLNICIQTPCQIYVL